MKLRKTYRRVVRKVAVMVGRYAHAKLFQCSLGLWILRCCECQLERETSFTPTVNKPRVRGVGN